MGYARPEVFGNAEVVESPPDVPLAGIAAIGPPGVVAGAGFEQSKGVQEAGVEDAVEPGALLVGETGVAPVLPRIREIDFPVGAVEIPAEHDRLRVGEPLQVGEEIEVPPLAVVEPGKSPLRIRRVDRDEVKFGEGQRDEASFAVVFGQPQAQGFGFGWEPGPDEGAAVAPFPAR